MGTGSQISILNDTWITNSPNFMLVDDTYYLQDFKVSELIDANLRVWKRDVITETFSEEDARRILAILLAKCAHDDFLM